MTILCVGGIPCQVGVACVSVMGVGGSPTASLSYGRCFVELRVPLLWDSVGVSGVGVGFIFWVAELVWEVFIGCVEHFPFVLDVDDLIGALMAYG